MTTVSPVRHARIVTRWGTPTAPRLGLVLFVGRERKGYYVAADRTEWGTDVRWDREDGAGSYLVRLTDGGTPLTCSCPGAKYAATCRHKAATAALVRVGEIVTE